MNSIVHRRLRPLYISSFFGGLVFWYAIEKIFMQSIGFDALSITLSVIVLSVTGLVLEVPSGILADRWSRKYVMALAYMCLVLASLSLGLSSNVPTYLIASILFGAYYALHSGIVDSVIYDILIEENGSRDGFEKFLGRENMISVIGLVCGSLFGSAIASQTNLQVAYFVTVPSALVAMLAALRIREPVLHKQQPESALLSHAGQTFRLIFRKGYIAWIVTAILSVSVVFSFLLEVDQLWPLALSLPTVWYGPLNALLLLGYGVGGLVAYKLLKHPAVLFVSFGVGILCIAALSVQSMSVVAVSQFGTLVLFVAYYTVAMGRLHDELPSHLRSGASSLVNTMINVLFIPAVLGLGLLVQKYDIFHAPYVILPIAVIGIVSMFMTLRHPSSATVASRPGTHPPSVVSGGL